MIRCEKDRNEFQMLKKMDENILCFDNGMFMTNCHSIVNAADLTLKQMFGLCTKLVPEQDEISGLETIGWESHYGNTCHWSVTKGLSIFNARRSTSFRILCCALGRFSKIHNRTMHGNKRLERFKIFRQEWNLFQGFNTLQLIEEVKRLLWRKARKFQRKNPIYVDVQWHFLWN